MANHILIGIGGTGYNVLRDFRKRMWAEEPDIKKRNALPVKFLYIDSDENMTPDKLAGNPDLRVNGQDTAITPDEYLGIKNVNLDSIFNNLGSFPRLRHVVGNGEFIRSCMGEVGKAAGQKRRAGRILFAHNAGDYINKVRNMIQSLNAKTGNSGDLNIYIFAGLAGGTGSGSIVDAVSLLISDPTLKSNNANIEVFAMIPEQYPPSGADAGRYHANGYAALSELSALNAGVFLPADVLNGNEHITLNRPGDNKQFGLTVYTNENRNNAVVDSYTVLPQLVADLMYFRIFSPETSAMKDLTKYFRSENRPDYLVEYKTNTRPGKPVERARTKAVGSFGIKRVRYPDEKLIAAASETIARDVLKMFLYMNFDTDAGFIDEPRKEAKDYNEYLKRENLKHWKLSAADLSLSVPILKPVDGKTPPTIKEYWESVSIDYDYDSAKEWGHPLTILEQYFEDRYKSENPKEAFREEKNVENYFHAKANEQVVADSANLIVKNISDNLFSQWQQGVYSVYDLKQISEKILELLQTKKKNMDADEVKLEDEIAQCDKTLADIFEDYENTGFLSHLLNKKRANLFIEYAKTLAKKYEAKTYLASLQIFQRRLIPKLVTEFSSLLSEIQDFLGKNQMYVEKYSALIAENIPAEEPDLRQANVEVVDIQRLNKFISELLHDKAKMEILSQKMRNYIAEGSANSFAKAGKKLANQGAMEEAAIEVLKDNILAYHAEMLKDKPVLGLNVLEQLYQMYGGSDDEIGRFANTLVKNSEVYIRLNDQEIKRMMNNTENATTTPAAGPNTIMLVAIPNISTDDEQLQDFVAKLRIKLEQAFNQTETRKLCLTDSPRQDEISIVSYENVFPIRAIDYMPFLKQKYEDLVNSNNESINTSNKVLLHAESDGSQLPPLFGEGNGPTGDALIKYIFLAVAYGIIRQGEDDFGNKGWGLVVTDIFGAETFTLLSPTFTGILSSHLLTPEISADIVEKVDEELNKQVHVNQKAAMAQTVKDSMKNYVLPEAGSPNNELYKRYAAQAMDALKVFM